MNVKDIRRQNLRALARSVGGVSKLAEHLEKSQSQISHLIGTNPVKNIGDKFAAHVESIFHKPYGWLDQMHLAEEEATYQVTAIANQVYYKVPLLTWPEAQQYFLDKKIIKKNSAQSVVTHIPLSPQAIALRVDGDSMEASHGPSFPAGTVIVLDPTLTSRNGSYVVAKQNVQSPLVFKQLVVDGARHYLKPLNQRYPLTDISSQTIICAVVRLMLLEFK
jgi:SOS-response transcriptional repressor LexA